MLTLEEIKLWLRVDETSEDEILTALLKVSRAVIRLATGATPEAMLQKDEDARELYKTIQKIVINDIFSGRDVENKALSSLYIQLESEVMSCG